ncbi:MAG: hypothetical protein H7Z75_06760 [Ferruginibacter sp.]|nr:hypothetical protein [Cytophagales bacterium]
MNFIFKSTLSKTFLVAGTVLLASACHFQDYNKAEQTDVRAGQSYVYGKDTVAEQSKNKYTPRPELEQRTAAIREKLFGGAGQAEAGN